MSIGATRGQWSWVRGPLQPGSAKFCESINGCIDHGDLQWICLLGRAGPAQHARPGARRHACSGPGTHAPTARALTLPQACGMQHAGTRVQVGAGGTCRSGADIVTYDSATFCLMRQNCRAVVVQPHARLCLADCLFRIPGSPKSDNIPPDGL